MNEIVEKLNNATRGFGVFITGFQILKVDMPEQVYEHQKEQWKTERQSIDTIMDGQIKASNIRSWEKARADAQRDLIISIADGLKKNRGGQYAESLLLSLSGILDNSLKDPLMRAYLAHETLETLEKIKTMLEKPVSQNILEKPVS
jgi:regulator of protease activity HflC (stomatin/prohibitin superfamily)